MFEYSKAYKGIRKMECRVCHCRCYVHTEGGLYRFKRPPVVMYEYVCPRCGVTLPSLEEARVHSDTMHSRVYAHYRRRKLLGQESEVAETVKREE